MCVCMYIYLYKQGILFMISTYSKSDDKVFKTPKNNNILNVT